MKKQRITFIISSALFLGLTILFAWAFIMLLLTGYPSRKSLVYEEGTFKEYVIMNPNEADSDFYYVIVDEYEQSLKIDMLISNKQIENALRKLDPGSKVVLCKYEDDGELILMSLSCGETQVLSYEYFMEVHGNNNRVGLVLCSIMICIGIALLVGNIVYYKKTGRTVLDGM